MANCPDPIEEADPHTANKICALPQTFGKLSLVRHFYTRPLVSKAETPEQSRFSRYEHIYTNDK